MNFWSFTFNRESDWWTLTRRWFWIVFRFLRFWEIGRNSHICAACIDTRYGREEILSIFSRFGHEFLFSFSGFVCLVWRFFVWLRIAREWRIPSIFAPDSIYFRFLITSESSTLARFFFALPIFTRIERAAEVEDGKKRDETYQLFFIFKFYSQIIDFFVWVCFAIGRLWFGLFRCCCDLDVCFSSSPKAKPASTITFTRRRRLCRPLQKNAHHSASNCSLFLLFSFCSRGTFYCFRSSIWSANTQCFLLLCFRCCRRGTIASAFTSDRHSYVRFIVAIGHSIVSRHRFCCLMCFLPNKTNNFWPLLFTIEI